MRRSRPRLAALPAAGGERARAERRRAARRALKQARRPSKRRRSRDGAARQAAAQARRPKPSRLMRSRPRRRRRSKRPRLGSAPPMPGCSSRPPMSPPTAGSSRPSSSRSRRCSRASRPWRGGRRCSCSPTAAAPTSWSRSGLLLDSTLPVIRSRTGRLSAELAQGQRLQQAALAARAELARSRDNLAARQQHYAALEQKAVQQALASGGQALGAERRRDRRRRGRRTAARRAGEQPVDPRRRRPSSRPRTPAPLSPFAPEAQPPAAALCLSAPRRRAGHRGPRRRSTPAASARAG